MTGIESFWIGFAAVICSYIAGYRTAWRLGRERFLRELLFRLCIEPMIKPVTAIA
jgi:ABC-type spermidine/putrescine transport system permease subunit I